MNPDAPQLSVQYIPGLGGYNNAVAGSPWSARVLDGSHTPSTFQIVSAPATMTLDPASGLLTWLPTPDDAGITSVAVRAINAASAIDIRFEFYVHFTGPVSNITVDGLTDLSPIASWTAPVGDGADRTAGYTIVARARYRYGRYYRTHTLNYESEGAEPSVLLTGLVSGRTYSLYVNPVDEADHRGLVNSPAVQFVSRPGIPSIGWTVLNANAYVTIRATNVIGPRDVTIGILVRFSGPVTNASALRTGSSAVASWTAIPASQRS